MQRHLYLDGARLYREAVPTPAGGNPLAFVWPFEEAAKAALCLRGVPGVGRQFADDIESVVDRRAYWQPHRFSGIVRKPSYASYPPLPLGHGGDTYFDDNTWIALDLVLEHRLRGAGLLGGCGDPLAQARAVFDLVVSGWCTDARPYPGGVYWVDAAWNRDRGAAVTAGLAALALHLAELSAPATADRARYLDHARSAYRWLRDTLWIEAGPERGLYRDKVLGDGGIDPTQWIYNQGVAVAAGALFFRVTGDRAYIEQARATADAALAWYGARQYAGQPAIFVAIFFRNLLELGRLLGTDDYVDALRAYADRAWDDRSIRDPATDLFRFGGPGSACTLLDQAAMVQVLALAAWPTDRYALLA